jgi:hypothetical protein
MAQKYRMYIGTILTYFQIGVNVIGLPDFHVHAKVISKSIRETELYLYQ